MIRIRNRKTYAGPGEYVGRRMPGLPGSPLANSYSVKRYGRERALLLYREWLHSALSISRGPARKEIHRLASIYRAAGELTLICWCRDDDGPGTAFVGEPCHAEIIRDAILAEVEHEGK